VRASAARHKQAGLQIGAGPPSSQHCLLQLGGQVPPHPSDTETLRQVDGQLLLQHWEVSNAQLAVQRRVPPSNPLVTQVSPSRLDPSHDSIPPIVPSPQQTPLRHIPLQVAGHVPPHPFDMDVVRQVAGQLGVQQTPALHTWPAPVQLAVQVPVHPSETLVVRQAGQLGVQVWQVPPLQVEVQLGAQVPPQPSGMPVVRQLGQAGVQQEPALHT